MIPDCCLYTIRPEDVPETPVRRPLASCDPEVVACYERVVVAREGVRRMLRAALLEGDLPWFRALADIDELVDRAQLRLEALR